MQNKFGITKDMIIEIMKGVSRGMRVFTELKAKYDVQLSNKNISEILGKIMEEVASKIFSNRLGYPVKKAMKDRDPDLYFTKIELPIEIKVTSTEDAWTGGEFSKRPFDYLLVAWGGQEYNEFFVCFTHLDKSDWKSNMAKNFYGPSLKAKTVYDKKDKIIFIGRLEPTPRGAVKIKRENINQKSL